MRKFLNGVCAPSPARAVTLGLTLGGLVFCLLMIAPAGLYASTQQAADDKQKKAEAPGAKDKDTGAVPNEKELEKSRKKQEASKAVELTPVERVVEIAILAYGGRKQLETARASIQEQGSVRLATDQGDLTGNFNLRSMRREKTWLDLLRVDLELTPPEAALRQGAPPLVKYVIAFNGATVWSAQNDQYINPRPEAEAAFRAQLTHEYMALLRYKEDGSKIELVGPETVVGLETNVVDLTNPNGEKTRYWISTRTYRVLHAEYELKFGDGQPATKYRISYFYTPQRVIQNTLVPARRVMYQDGKFAQEVTLANFNYSAKIDPEVFQHLQGQQ